MLHQLPTPVRRNRVEAAIRSTELRFLYWYDVQRLQLAVELKRRGATFRELWMLPQTLAVEALAPLALPIAVLLVDATLVHPRLLDRINPFARERNTAGPWGGLMVHSMMQNHADWDSIGALLRASLDALYVRASAEAGECNRPDAQALDSFFSHVTAVAADARAWELDLPKPYLWARRIVGLLLGVGWLHVLSGAADWADHLGEALAHGMDSLHSLADIDVEHAASLFDLKAMLATSHVDQIAPHTASLLPDPHGFGAPSEFDGDPRVNPVHGYFRGDGTFVRAYWRGARG